MDTYGPGEKARGRLVLRPQPGNRQNQRTAWDRPSLGPCRHLDLSPQPPERSDETLLLSKAPICGRLCGSEASTPPGDRGESNDESGGPQAPGRREGPHATGTQRGTPATGTQRGSTPTGTQRSRETGPRRPWSTPSFFREGLGHRGQRFGWRLRPPERLPEPSLCTNILQFGPERHERSSEPKPAKSYLEYYRAVSPHQKGGFFSPEVIHKEEKNWLSTK